MYITWSINYLLIGFVFQWFMHWGASKVNPEEMFTHKERVMLIIGWPIGVLGFIYSFIISMFRHK